MIILTITMRDDGTFEVVFPHYADDVLPMAPSKSLSVLLTRLANRAKKAGL